MIKVTIMKKALAYCTMGFLAAESLLLAQEDSKAQFNTAGMPPSTELAKLAAPARTDFQVKKISLFKNGYGFFDLSAKAGSAESPASAISLSKLPAASYGTFWFHTSGDSKITHLLSRTEDRQIALKNFSHINMLDANPGKKVTIITNKNETFTGTPTLLQLSGEILPELEDQQQTLLSLETSTGLILLPKEDIRQIIFPDSTDLKTPTAKVKTPVVDIYFDKPQKGTEVSISCISHGITWMPSFLIDITDEKNALIEGKASIINNLMDIKDSQLDLISGYPAIQFAGTPSPITATQNLTQVFNSLQRNDHGRSMHKMTLNAVAAQEMAFADEMEAPPAPAPSLDNIQSEDLYFYPIGNFTCAKNDTVTLPLFKGEIPYTHIYTWNIRNQGNNLWQRSSQSNMQEDIWHCIKFTNTLPIPLTSAPVEFISKGRIVGQNSLTFIGSGAEARVQINKSMEFKTDMEEKLLSQERKQVTFNKSTYNFTEFNIEGKITVTNRSKRDIVLEITKPIQGQNVQAENATITLDKAYSPQNNLNGIIKWTLNIKTGETQTIPYTYSYVQ